MKKIKFYSLLFLINNFLKGTRFFSMKRKLLNNMGVKIGKKTKIVGPILINYVNDIEIGEECWIGKDFTIDGNGKVIIGDKCDLGPGVTISTGGHNLGNEYRRAGKGVTYNSKIMSGSWIGTKVLILNGSNIGEGSVVAAGSVVINDVESNSLVAGTPAKKKRVLL